MMLGEISTLFINWFPIGYLVYLLIGYLFEGPKLTENVFEEEELLPFCKFCFAKNYKLSALNVAETVQIV